MPRRKKPKQIPKDHDVRHATAIAIGYGIEKGVDFILKCLDEKKEPQPTPKPQEAEIKVAPPLPTFIQEQNAIYTRRLEHEKLGKKFLKRLK
jgi:hypothetical protein